MTRVTVSRLPMNKQLKLARKYRAMYVMMIPGLLFLFVYKFFPLYGLLIAFKDFNIFLGSNPFEAISMSPWVGLEHFRRLFGTPDFTQVFSNTVAINALKILFLFPLPLLFAILLKEIRSSVYQKLAQTCIYIPYFFSWVVVFGIFYSLLGSYGIVNSLLIRLGMPPIAFFTDRSIFRGVLIVTEGWKEVGWYAVIYLAAISGIDPTMYEAARIDGASRFRQIVHITIPSLFPTIVLLFIMKVGYILDTGFEQILVMYNPTVYSVADIIQTYVYRIGLGQMDYSLGTALGLFNSIIAFVLILCSNAISKKLLQRSIW